MKPSCILIALFASGALAMAADKPTAYDHITKDGATIDQQVNAALSLNYNIVPVEDSPTYVGSKAIAGSLPDTAKTSSGEPLQGYVLIAYVVSEKGHAVNPVILKTTDPRLNSIATKAMADWRFEPAKLNGAPIATTAAQEFNFKDTTPRGFVTTHIVLYQPDEVLAQRVSSADQLATYIKQLQTVLTDFFSETAAPETLQIIVAIRPGNQSRVWFVSSTRSGNSKALAPLREKLEAVQPVDVRKGPIAFAMAGSIAGAEDPSSHGGNSFQPPIPRAWKEAAQDLKKPVLVPDGFLDAVWPDKK